MMMVMGCVLIMMVAIRRQRAWRGMVMCRAARCLDHRSEPLDGQCRDQQPEQDCLEDTIHLDTICFASLPWKREGSVPALGKQSMTSHSGKVKHSADLPGDGLACKKYKAPVKYLPRQLLP